MPLDTTFHFRLFEAIRMGQLNSSKWTLCEMLDFLATISVNPDSKVPGTNMGSIWGR